LLREKVARMLRAYEPLILNWFRAKGEVSSAAVEGLKNKIRVVTRRSYGFRTYEALEIAPYHNLTPGARISPQILLRRPFNKRLMKSSKKRYPLLYADF
jgi:hypothetical protein